MTSPLLQRPLRSHIRACAEIAAAAHGAPTMFRFGKTWIAAKDVTGDALPDAMLLPRCWVIDLDQDAAVEMLRRFAPRAGHYELVQPARVREAV